MPSNLPPPISEHDSRSEVSNMGKAQVKIPYINIDPFDGDPVNYPAFIDSFCRIIHENTSLTDIEELYYLGGLLRCKAKATIEGLALSEVNYREALDLYEERFGDKKLLQASFVRFIVKTQGCVRRERHESIVKLTG